jgi:LmbE family N-acetylglucosaminyl deacetylase
MALKVMLLKTWLLKRLAPLPALDAGRVYVFVGPHPDDLEIGCGATVAKLARLGKTVMFVIATDGGAGAKDPAADVEALVAKRRGEAQASADLLGAEVTFLPHPDGGRHDVRGLAEELALRLIEWQADFVFGPDPNLASEIHPDHLAVGNAVKEAVFLAGNPLALVRRGYPVPSGMAANLAFYYTAKPNRGWRLSKDDVKKQLAAIGQHQSQFPDGARGTKDLHAYLRLQKTAAGIRLLSRYADRFRVLGGVHQHCFPEVERY